MFVGVGSAAFVAKIKANAGWGERETERRGRLRERVAFADVVDCVAGVREAPAEEWLHRHADWSKWLVLRLARQYTGMTLRELGDQMGGMDYSAVSVGLKRFEARLKRDGKARRMLSRAETLLNVET